MYPITSRYLEKESFRSHPHLGIDFACPESTPLRSIQDGTILKVVDYGNANVGKAVFVKWSDGKVAVYGHMKEISVTKGMKVKTGDLLGYSGNSGHVVGENGYHLHFGLKGEDGSFLDPTPYVQHIQHMNDPDKLKLLAGGAAKLDVTMASFSLTDLLKAHAGALQELLSSIKLNFAHTLSSIDYSVIVKCLQNVFQLFF